MCHSPFPRMHLPAFPSPRDRLAHSLNLIDPEPDLRQLRIELGAVERLRLGEERVEGRGRRGWRAGGGARAGDTSGGAETETGDGGGGGEEGVGGGHGGGTGSRVGEWACR